MKIICKWMLATTLVAGALLAQGDKSAAPAAEPEYFRMDFVVKEIQDGKVVNSRSYSLVTLASGKDRGSVRAGTKMPVQTGSPQSPAFQYVDVGVNIDCNSVQRLQNRLTMYVSAELSTVAPPQDKGVSMPQPIRSNRWNSPVIVPIGKSTLLFSSDDLASTRTLQLEVTATPVK
jgi:hypothetical protein